MRDLRFASTGGVKIELGKKFWVKVVKVGGK